MRCHCRPRENRSLAGALVNSGIVLKAPKKESQTPHKAVWQYTPEGELVACYESVHDAAKATGIERFKIVAASLKQQATAGGFIWGNSQQQARDKAAERKAATEHRVQALLTRRSKAVCQLSMSGELIAIHASTQAAGRATDIQQSRISQAARGKIAQAGGFLWRYADHHQ